MKRDTFARIEAADPYRVDADSASFTAVIEGSSVTLTFTQGLGFTANVTGSIEGDRLSLAHPAEDGSLVVLDFEPATAADYNAVVQSLHKVAADAQAEKEAQEAFVAQQVVIDDASAAVLAESASLQEAEKAARSHLESTPQALQRVEERLAATLEQLQELDSADPYDLCYQAGEVEYAASEVEYAASEVEFTLDPVTSELDAIKESIAGLRSQFNELQTYLSELPDYRPAGLPSEADVSGAIETARAQIAEFEQTGSDYRNQADEMVQTARGYADQALAACG